MRPIYLPRDELVRLLDDMREHVASGDSFEGFVQYLLPDDGDDPDGFRVEARYRVGNLQGQGGMRVIGRLT
jgi:hypothetical protein